MIGRIAIHWLRYRLGLSQPLTQTTAQERKCLERHAADRHALVEIGVMHGVTSALLRQVMHEDGRLTAIDPHPRGRLGISFERLISLRELRRHDRGSAELLRAYSWEVARTWNNPIDFLFIDGDHSWTGIDRDWRDWSGFITPGGIAALHDSVAVGGHELDSVRYTHTVILADPRFRLMETVDSLSILQRL